MVLVHIWMADGCVMCKPPPLAHTAFAWLAQQDGWVLEAPGAAAGTAG